MSVFQPGMFFCPISLLLAATLFAGTPHQALAKTATAASGEVSEKQNDLKELRDQIDHLRRDLAAAEGSRSEAADQLKDIEREISATQRELHKLALQRGELQTTLKKLENQSRDLEVRLGGQRKQLEKLLYRQYLLGNPDPLRLLLNGDNPAQVSRDLYYLASIGHARNQWLEEIESSLQRKQVLADDIREQADQLAGIEKSQREQHQNFLEQREKRKATLEHISANIAAQRREIGTLQRDQKRLSELIERLSKIIAARPKPKPVPAEPARSARPETPLRNDAPGNKPSPREIINEKSPEPLPSGHFAKLKGHLRLPAKGTVTNRFGATRQEGNLWKGLFIRAQASSEVKSIAPGRVVFADWMRGFGNLLIVDHGDHYLSIYGNNEALLKQPGESVAAGDALAVVGNSGGNPETGLYFELRHQGQPFDPMKWVSIK